MATDRPMVNAYEGDPPALVYRPMTDAEYAQWQADQEAAADTPPPAPQPTPTEVASQMADTITTAVAAVPDTGTVADLKTAIVTALAPYTQPKEP